MANPLLDFFGSLLGATPSQQPQPAPTPGFSSIAGPPSPGVTAQQTTPAHYGLMDVLGSPGAQGALATYFSLLAQPRTGGWARGLGNAGLGGLQAFEGARAEQGKLPLQQAELAKAQAEVPKMQAETQNLMQTMQQRKQMVDQFDKDPRYANMDPLQKMSIRQGLTEGKIDPAMLGLTPYQKAELGLKKETMTSEEKHRQAEEDISRQHLGIESATAGSEMALRGAEMGEIPLRRKALEASVGLSEARSKFLTSGGPPLTDAQMHALAKSQAAAEVKVPAPGTFEGLTGTSAAAGAKLAARTEEIKRQLRAERDAKLGMATGAPAGSPDIGAHEVEESLP